MTKRTFFILLSACSVLLIGACMRQVPPVILEYPPRAFESLDSVRMEQRIARHMSGRVAHLYYTYEDSLGNDVQHGPDIVYYLDGLKKQVQYYRKGKLWGPASYWYNNGQRQGISYYRDGRLNGPAKVWYKSGKLQSVKYWKNGKLHGPQNDYDSLGNLGSSKFWNDNRLVPVASQPADTVRSDTIATPRILPDTLPVTLPVEELPAAHPQYYPAQ